MIKNPNLNHAAKILMTIPRKKGDPTEYTSIWGLKAKNMGLNLGYKVKTLEGSQVTRKNVEKEMKEFDPDAAIHLGHGCKRSWQGNEECVISKRYTVNELISLGYSNCKCDRDKAYEILSEHYNIDGTEDPCDLACLYDTNVDILQGKIVLAIACNTSAGLGRDAIDSGAQAYLGLKDLLMFPVDSLETEKWFGDLELVPFRELLLGNSTLNAYNQKIKVYDKFIKDNKKIKYISLPALWNRLNSEILGDTTARLYQ